MTTTTINEALVQLDIAVAVAEDAFDARRRAEEAKFAAHIGFKRMAQYKWSQLNLFVDAIMLDSCEAVELTRARNARKQYR